MTLQQKTLRLIAAVALLAISVGGWFSPAPAPQIVPLGTTNLGGLALSETLAVTGASTLTGAVTAAGDMTLDDTLNIDDTDSTITGTQTLIPTASFYQFNPASTLTLTLSTTAGLEGDFLWMTNLSASKNVVVVDTTATAGGSNRTLGKNDVIGFLFSNSLWVEAFYSDNS